MATSIDPNVTHDHSDDHHGDTHQHGCMCDGECECETSALDGPSLGSSGSSVVTDYTALLYYQQSNSLRWNGQTDVGTAVVVTYSFTETAELAPASTDPYGATAYWAYNETQRTLFREVAAQYEAVSGVIFVEIEGDAMINIHGSSGGNAGGWANVAQSTASGTSNGTFTNNYSNMGEGAYGYQVNLHELGHAMGLQHPHEGLYTLDSSVDTQENTVMTYNISHPYATELGTFDIQAMQDIYGTADAFDGWDVSVAANDMVKIKASLRSETILAADQDTLVRAGGGDDTVIGREGDDRLDGGSGNDTITGALGNDRLFGDDGDDLLMGDLDTNAYSGSSTSNDRLEGQAGNDTLYGNDGADKLFGGRDDDYLDGGYESDLLRGGKGNDTMTGGEGADRMTGDAGSDVFLFTNADANETDRILDFTVGEDVIDVSALSFTSLSQFTQTVTGGDTFIAYSSWFEIELSNFTETLSSSDFIFA